MTREPTPASSRSSTPERPVLPPMRTSPPPMRVSPPMRASPPVSASSAASIQAKLSSSLSAALLGTATSYRAPFARERSASPRRHRSTDDRHHSDEPRHTATRQHTYPFTRADSPPPALAPIGRPDYPQSLPSLHKAQFPAALPAPPTTKPHDFRYQDDERKLVPLQAVPHVGALQAAPHVGAFHSMPVVGVFQGTAPPPAELPISVWQAHPLVRTRARITREQLRALEALFAKTWFPTSQQRADAATATGMREYSVTVWFQNRRSKAKKEGISPPEGDRAKLRKDKGPKRDLGTHVFEVGSSRHPEPIATTYASSSAPEHNLVWLEDARSRGRAPVMKAAPRSPQASPPRSPDNPPRSRSPRSRSWSGDSDEIESESESRPSPHPRESEPSYSRAYTQYAPREAHTLYPPREPHPSYAEPPPMRRQSSSSSHYSSVPRRRNSAQSDIDEPEPAAKRSRRENEHTPDHDRSDPE